MGTGNPTVLRALARCIEPHERLITIEDPYELALDTAPAPRRGGHAAPRTQR